MKNVLELFVSFLKIGALMFGSGYTMLPLLLREVVERRAWITEDELMDAYALSQCVPGVIAVNTAAFVGQKRGGWGGAAAAVLGVIAAPVVAILLVATVLMQFWNSPTMVSIFNGVRVAVAAVITNAVIQLVRSNVKNWLGIALCAAGFVIIALLHLSPVFVVLLAIIVGFVLWGVRR
ncbi:MAG: chromate transporter [Eubacteriales bacterium]|nr:chromate transporter [Eubacteriales bacterium]